MKIVRLIIILLFFYSNVFSQIPNKFKYQAVLRDVSGNVLANENVLVDISILKGSINGTSVFTEQHNVTTTAQGLINLNIGSVTDLKSVNFSTDTYYIQLSVDGTVMGTSQLLSVPYALYASNLAMTSPNGETYTSSIDDFGNVNYKNNNSSPLNTLLEREKFILNNLEVTKYVHSSDSIMDESRGIYNYDCSGFICEFAIKKCLPEHYQNLYDVYHIYHDADSRPRAWSFYDYFRDILGDNYDADDIETCTAENEYWKVFTSIDSVKKGDLLISRYHDDWRTWYNSENGTWPSTGHVMTVWSTPLKVDGTDYEYDLKIMDSTSSPHGSDSREYSSSSADGSGIGYGWMRFKVSTHASKRPYQYKWKPSSDNYYTLYSSSGTTDNYNRIQGIIFARPISNL